MSTPALALIHSPLLGPMTWQAVAGRLRDRGRTDVRTPAASAWQVGPPYYPSLAELIAADLGGADSWTLVGHSGAGGLLPAVAQAMNGRVGAALFVDAILPHPGQSWLDTAPPPLRAALSKNAREGSAPAWPSWFPPATSLWESTGCWRSSEREAVDGGPSGRLRRGSCKS